MTLLLLPSFLPYSLTHSFARTLTHSFVRARSPCVQVLEVRRDGCDLPPRPFTTIRYDDELTLVGRPTVLSQCTAIKKGCARGSPHLALTLTLTLVTLA